MPTPFSLVAPGWPGIVGQDAPPFSLPSYLASVSGSYWDFTKTDDQFQENTGPTLADDVGEAIGLKLDRAQWGGKTLAQVIAAATELVTNGTFDSDLTGWTDASTAPATLTWDAATQSAKLVRSDTNNARMDQSFATVAGGVYRISADIATLGCNLTSGATQGSNTFLNTTLGLGTNVRYIVATGTTTWIRFFTASIGTSLVDNVSVTLIPGIPAIQSTGTLKPTLQLTGAKFDGSDDNLLTSYLAGAGSNFIVALVTFAATPIGTQIIAGAQDATPSRFHFAHHTTGVARAGIGNTVALLGTTIVSSTETVVGLTTDGATLNRLFVASNLEAEGAFSGLFPAAVPLRIGGLNTSGSATNFFGGSIKRLVAGKDFLTLSRYQQIRSALLAA